MSAEDDVDAEIAALLAAEPVDSKEDREALDDTDDLTRYDDDAVLEEVSK